MDARATHVVVFILLSLAATTSAQTTDPNTPASPTPQAQTEPMLLGDPIGARTWLFNHGITPDIKLSLEEGKNAMGGLDTAGSSFQYLFTFNLTLDTEKLFKLKGGTVYFSFQDQHGQSPSDEVGDFQFVSSQDPGGRTQLAEAWYQQSLFDNKASIKLGKIDSNNDFGLPNASLEFCNASIGFPLSNAFMPTYPDPAFGLDSFVRPNDMLQFGAGIFDGALAQGIHTGELGPATLFGPPADLYLIAELGIFWKLKGATLPGAVRGGAWYETGSIARFDGSRQSGTSGGYVVLEQALWRAKPDDAKDPRGLDAFAIWDVAQKQVMIADQHVAGGVAWTGPIAGRGNDILGLGVTAARFSDDPAAGFVDRWETSLECFYKIQLTPYLSVKPDVQYVMHPGGRGTPDALVGLLRFDVAF